jgi:hypothetical protein
MKHLCAILLVFVLSSCVHKGTAVYLRKGEVKIYNNRAVIFINEKPVSPLIYAVPDPPPGRWAWNELPQHNIKLFGNIAGINLVQLDIFLDHLWLPDGSLKLDTALMQIRGALDANPNAAVMFRLHVNAPRWWQEKHQEEAIVYSDAKSIKDYNVGYGSLIEGDVTNIARFSLASEKWRNEASETVKKFCKELAKTPEGNALIGIQVACGVYGEWHYFGFTQHDPDLSQPMTNYFRNWLKKKYKTNEALGQAWGKSNVTFETAAVPGSDERNYTLYGVFRDPDKERNVIDYFEAQHLVVAEDILHFCKVVKESWPRPIITGSFYGYFYSLFGREAAGGHLAIDTVLKSMYIDFLSAPQAYYPMPNLTGEPYRSRGLLESVRLNGKLWLDEMDQQPPLVNTLDSNYKASVKESIARLRRNIMFTATKGMGMWFYDFGLAGISWEPEIVKPGSWSITSGWWEHPDLLSDVNKLKGILDKNLEKPYQSDADVLMVYDTRSFYSMVSQGHKTNINNILINWTAPNMMKAGVVFDAIYLSDLGKVDLSRYKVVIFNNTFVLNQTQRQYIRDKVMKDGRDIIWFYAPGYSDNAKLDVKLMTELTGISLIKTDETTLPVIKTTALPVESFSYDIRKKVPKSESTFVCCDDDSPYTPLFAVNDKDAETLGIYLNDKKPAIVKKKLPFCTSYYIALPAYESGLMKGILQLSQAHKYTNEGDIVYSGNGLLSFHSKNGGLKRVSLRNGKIVDLNMDNNSTVILDNQTGEILMK